MGKNFDDIKFSISPKMAQALIDYDIAKKRLDKLKSLDQTKMTKEILEEISQNEKKIVEFRNAFIQQFRLHNIEEIKEYIELRDEINNLD